ncbi:MAG: 30S ribosomal protein S18 [Candidatus Zambryskibacteria bacterium CG11_big_fil_rev_8_21_14_0_20_42_18]|uniref:Small ribosomal subunit protein bS18 n=1 Tax=Candidatus Zambryskibacteria bacterium CG_4_9_14_3_um_filter_42_15 TaxID=1975112 RepID=A0A2M7WSW4_9BACT|nr:MAG: 30S ribosomal protein S18 [Candidatus Zambryskibacteria bacterium CG11_big_fil_rev_8_21_14_0_20_42_18]PJA33043.1 MAG: 30S ribosomal protein S18 [Candidatus Zambryskibacteria bacterium CG_4_9_14_3_um_filter_42_15]
MRKQNYFKENKIEHIDYKDVDTLKKFLTSHSRIQSRKRSSVPSKFERQLALAIKRARFLGLLPYVSR